MSSSNPSSDGASRRVPVPALSLPEDMSYSLTSNNSNIRSNNQLSNSNNSSNSASQSYENSPIPSSGRSHTSTLSSSYHDESAPPFSQYPSYPARSNPISNTTPQSSYKPGSNPGMAGAPTTQINLVSYRSATIKALIDPSLPVSDVIRQLCANSHLGVQEPPALFALRDEETEELIDDGNMERKIRDGKSFK